MSELKACFKCKLDAIHAPLSRCYYCDQEGRLCVVCAFDEDEEWKKSKSILHSSPLIICTSCQRFVCGQHSSPCYNKYYCLSCMTQKNIGAGKKNQQCDYCDRLLCPHRSPCCVSFCASELCSTHCNHWCGKMCKNRDGLTLCSHHEKINS